MSRVRGGDSLGVGPPPPPDKPAHETVSSAWETQRGLSEGGAWDIGGTAGWQGRVQGWSQTGPDSERPSRREMGAGTPKPRVEVGCLALCAPPEFQNPR